MAFLLAMLHELLKVFGFADSNSFMVFLNVSVGKILNFYLMLLKPIGWLFWNS